MGKVQSLHIENDYLFEIQPSVLFQVEDGKPVNEVMLSLTDESRDWTMGIWLTPKEALELANALIKVAEGMEGDE